MAVLNPWNAGGAVDSLPSTGGAPQSNAQSIWEAGANASPSLGAPGNFASPYQLTQLGAGLPAGVGAYPAASPPAQSPSANAPGQPSAPQTPANSPWLPNVTSTSMDGSVTPFSTPGNPNINYINQGAAADIARRYGANLVSSGNVMGGSVSDPMYGLDFGAGDPMSAGQIAFWEQRNRETPGSDTPEMIRQRLYQSPAWWTNVPGGAGYVNPNIVRNNDVNWNFSSPLSTNLPVGGVNQGFETRSAAQSDLWKKALENAGDSAANLGNGGTVQIGTPPRLPQRNEAPQQLSTAHYDNPQMQSVMAFLSMLLGGGNVSSLFAQLFGGQGQTSRQPNLTNARNTAFQRNYFYPNTEPRLY